MNGLSVNELCCLFCCPPCPSKIVAKLAFLPPQPTYKLIVNGDQTLYPPPPSEQTALHNTNNRSSTTGANSVSATPTTNGTNNTNNSSGNIFTNFIQVSLNRLIGFGHVLKTDIIIGIEVVGNSSMLKYCLLTVVRSTSLPTKRQPVYAASSAHKRENRHDGQSRVAVRTIGARTPRMLSYTDRTRPSDRLFVR